MRAWYLVGAAVLVLLFTINGVGSRAPEKPLPQARIALVNVAYVLKYWDKANHFNEEMKTVYEPFQEKEAKLTKRREKLQKELQASLSPGGSEPVGAGNRKLTEEIAELTAAIEKNSREAKFAVAERSSKQLVTLQGDLDSVTRRYAEAHHLELVLSYADAFTEADLRNPYLIERKLKTPPCLPMYIAPEANISKEIVAALNLAAKADKKEKADLKKGEGP